MATISPWELRMKDTRRPCIVEDDGIKRRCLFHRWSTESEVVAPSLLKGGHPGGTISTTVAILEFEDGSVKKYTTSGFKFVDGGDFGDFIWFDENEGEQND